MADLLSWEQGNADFDIFLVLLNKYNLRWSFIMQAYRDNDGLSVFKNTVAMDKTVFGRDVGN